MSELGTYGGASKSAGGEASGGSGVGSIMEAGGLQEDARGHMLEGPEGKYSVGRVVTGGFSRDMTVASGTQAVTGLGLKPYAIFIFCATNAGVGQASFGFSNGVNDQAIYDAGLTTADTWNFVSITYLIYCDQGAANFTQGSISSGSLDLDGFTIDWLKTGSPTGTLQCKFLAFGRG